MPELRLTHLTYAGSKLPLAQVTFGTELTVICGDSDTGKTFIVDSIEYMLAGRQKAPSTPRASGYSQIMLGLLLPDGRPLTLVRAPGSNTIHVHLDDLRDLTHAVPHTTVSARRSSKGNDLSTYLLQHLDLGSAYVRTNEQGNTEPLVLPDIAHLAVVTDARIDSETPPAQRTRGSSNRTRARSVMRLALTGDDEPPADLANAAQRRIQRGKIALLDQLVVDAIAKIQNPGNLERLQRQLATLEATLNEAIRSHHRVSAQQSQAIADRTRLNEQVARLAVRLNEIADLLGRFELLRQQYESDLDRLAMVSEAGNLLGYFRTGRCVFCGAEPEHQHPEHQQGETTQLHQAVAAETHKTRELLADLDLTIVDLESQSDSLAEEMASLNEAGDNLNATIAEIGNQLDPLATHLDSTLAKRTELQRDVDTLRLVQDLEARRFELSGDTAARRRSPTYIPGSALTAYDHVLQRTLAGWHVPNATAATWDHNSCDVRAGGSPRSSRGRGIRALLHAAFSTALAQYCVERHLPHLGFLVLDSPLVTFGQLMPDDEEVPLYVKDHFYRYFLDYPTQRVIVENSAPPTDVAEGAHIVLFKRNGERPGFFPERRQTSRSE